MEMVKYNPNSTCLSHFHNSKNIEKETVSSFGSSNFPEKSLNLKSELDLHEIMFSNLRTLM